MEFTPENLEHILLGINTGTKLDGLTEEEVAVLNHYIGSNWREILSSIESKEEKKNE